MREGSGEPRPFPRLVLGGLSGDAGKTLVSLAVTLGLRARGMETAVFKKGPDYIDAAWLSWAAGRAARNLDSWMAGFERARESFRHHASPDGVNLVEGNRGLFDGVDAVGTHSTAELAKSLQAPVVLIVDAQKATRTLAAAVLGCQVFDPALRIAGVILNRVAGRRHVAIAREAIETRCGVPVLGAIPRLTGGIALPDRHMGLVPPEEHPSIGQVRETALAVASHVDLDALVEIARDVPPLERWSTAVGRPACGAASAPNQDVGAPSGTTPRIGYLRDSAFGFYYPDNLEALEDAGATLVPVPSLSGHALPADLDALYIGGGFPETHAAALAANRALLESLACTAAAGLPIYAECGGLMLLARTMAFRGKLYRMAGVLPCDVEVCDRPQGHGYSTLSVEKENPFFRPGTVISGHEFHYSRVSGVPPEDAGLPRSTACAVLRGVGCGAGRDAIVANNVWASYTHVHALGTPEWALGLVGAAARCRAARGRR